MLNVFKSKNPLIQNQMKDFPEYTLVLLEDIPVKQVMLGERMMPDSFILPSGNDVTVAFADWCRPLRKFVFFH